MIYLALVTFVAVLGQGMRTSVTDGVDRVVAANYVVTADDHVSPLPPAVGEALAALPGAGTASSVRKDSARAFGSEQSVNGLDPATIGDVVRLDWDTGSATSLAQLGGDDAVLQRRFATDHDLRIGSRFAMETAQGRKLELTVRGDLHAAPHRRNPRSDRHRARAVRRLLRAAAGRLHVPQREQR